MAQDCNMGRYLPPDVEGTMSRNQFQGKRAPGVLKKDGTQTVRFELPFAIWCHSCKPHAIIGQGVRFNAQKKKCGQYHSTAIWSFRFTHSACGGLVEIRTDPKNTQYIVVEGARARDYGDRNREDHAEPILTSEERQQRRDDAFAQFEGEVEERKQIKDNKQRIDELYESRDAWNDTWRANKKLRQSFREQRKQIQKMGKADQAIKDRLGTNLDLLPATEEDAMRAKLVSFGGSANESEDCVSSKPMFRLSTHKISKSKGPGTRVRGSRKDHLQKQLIANTRGTLNPFG